MQIALVAELLPCGGYENLVTVMDVFSCYFFAYPVANQYAKTIAENIINILTKHAYLPTTLICDKRSAFVSQVIKEVAYVHGITLQPAITKHAQTIGMLERSHEFIKQALEIERASEDHCGINTSALRSLNITLLTTQALTVSQSECFMHVVLIMS